MYFLACEFKCEADDKCIRKDLVCDGYSTCSDRQDEVGCGNKIFKVHFLNRIL